MTHLNDIPKLDDYEDEDIGDVIAKLEKSFKIKFDKYAFSKVDNFGKLCDVIEASLSYNTKDDCTKQQAFYKLRKAISLTQLIDKTQIKPETKLLELFPKQICRKQVKEFQKQLGIKLKFLTYPGWLTLVFLAGLIASLIAFFFDWRMAVSGILFFALAFRLADIFGKDLEVETIQQLANKAVREHYIDIRRSKLTMNKCEILEIIKDTFSNHLNIDKEYLTRESTFSWTKSSATNNNKK